MSSPFRVFRKHSRGMMAALVLLCIGLFVFNRGSGGSTRNNDPRGDAKALVATWNGGSINQQELGQLVSQRLILDAFLTRLFQQGGGTSGYDLPRSIPPFLLRDRNHDAVQQEVLETEVLSSLARDAGMTVSDDLINHYIEEFGLKNVNNDEIAGILGSIGRNSAGNNEAIVFGTLRKLLLAYFYQRGYDNTGFLVLPQERWEDWRRVNERISVTAAILPVDAFLAEVPQPTDAQLQGFYNDYKENEPNQLVSVMGRPLTSAEPGFREPRRVQLQFVLGSVAERAAKLAPSITDEEIKDYYERNKRTDFIKLLDLSDDEEDSTEEPAASAPADKSGEDAAKPAEDAAKPAEDAAKPAEGEGDPKAGEAEKAAPKEGESSEAKPRSPFRLTALQAPATASAEATPADAAAADSAKEPAAKEGESTDAAPAPSDEAVAKKTDGEEEKVEYEPLDKVKDDIRQTLATDKAVDELERVMGDVMAQLQTEYNRYASRVAEAKELNKPLPPPSEKLADLNWIAEKYGLSIQKTAPLTARELSETAIGKAADTQTQTSLLQAMFTTAQLNEPILARDLNGDWYLALKVADEPSRVPPFDEVRDKVLEAWKRREAAKLAEKKAQELATASEAANQPFNQFFSERGYKVVDQTAMFSWRSYLTGPGQGSLPILSEVPELEGVGPDFMEAVFKLDGNKTVGILNFDHSAAYVVRLHSRQWSPEELKEQFLDDANTWPGQLDLRQEHAQEFTAAASKETLEGRAGFKFDETWLANRLKQATEEE